MKKNLLLLTLISGLVACGGGGGGNPTPTSIYPIGYCIESGSTALAVPQLITGATSESVVYGYNNDGSFGNAVQVTYSEASFQPSTNLAFFDVTRNLSNLPNGYCSISPSSPSSNYLTNTTMYFSSCTANVSNGVLSFYSTYSVYQNGTQPGTGTPLSSGTLNFTCPFKAY